MSFSYEEIVNPAMEAGFEDPICTDEGTGFEVLMSGPFGLSLVCRSGIIVGGNFARLMSGGDVLSELSGSDTCHPGRYASWLDESLEKSAGTL